MIALYLVEKPTQSVKTMFVNDMPTWGGGVIVTPCLWRIGK